MNRIDLKSLDLFKDLRCPLRETSKGIQDETEFYMTESLLEVINFDAAKDRYIQSLSMPKMPKSNDALYISNDGEIYFIEFKTGNLRSEIQAVQIKILDKLLLFTDMINQGISYTRQHISYILVYNEADNLLSDKEINEIQVSPSRERIKSYFIRKANDHFIRFSLKRLKKMYLKDIFTVTEAEFEDNFIKKWIT